tara:strand:- start:4645 stop:5085 length:441 start_codon:yes stop_codon:yes gene_type:complete
MGVPENDVVAGVDLLDSFCKEHGITEVMYSSLGPVNTSARMDTIGRTLANNNEAKTISTQTQSMGIVNWVGRSNNDTTIPLWPLRADYVVVLTNPQYRRQIRRHGKQKKLSWSDWYQKQNIPIYIYDVTTKHGAQIPSIKHIDEFK